MYGPIQLLAEQQQQQPSPTDLLEEEVNKTWVSFHIFHTILWHYPHFARDHGILSAGDL